MQIPDIRDDFINALKMLFEDLDADAIDTDELGAELEHLFDQNPQVEFARKVSKMELDVLDKMLLVLFCHELVNEDNDNIKFFEMEKLFPSKGVFMKERSALGNDNHPLIRQKLIEQCCVDGIADNTSFCLTEYAKTTLLAEPLQKRGLGGVMFCWFYADFSSKREIPSRFSEILAKSFFMLYASPSKRNSVLMLFLPLHRNLLKP